MFQILPRSRMMTTTRMRNTMMGCALGVVTGVTTLWCGVTLLAPPAGAQGTSSWLSPENSPLREPCAAEPPEPMGFPGEELQRRAVNTSNGVTLDEIYLRAKAVIIYNKLYADTTRSEREALQRRLLERSPYAEARARVAQARGSQPPQWYQDLREWRRNNVKIAQGAPNDIGDPNRRSRTSFVAYSLGSTPTEFYRRGVILSVRQAGLISRDGGERSGCQIERQRQQHMDHMEELKEEWMRRNNRM